MIFDSKDGKLYPLSRTQLGILVESLGFEGSTVYNIPVLFRLDDRVDIGRLKAAVYKTLEAHPYLSAYLGYNVAGEPVILKNSDVTVKVQLLDTLPDKEALVRPFDLNTGGALCRVALIDSPEGKYLFIDTHHIISDGASFAILLEDINAAYEGRELEKEDCDGFEFALDEQKLRDSSHYTEAKAFYDSKCRGCDSVSLPQSEKKLRTDLHIARFTYYGRTDLKAVRAFCEENGFTLNAFFTTAFGLALRSYTGSESAVFATIYNGRFDPRLSRAVCMFVKTLPVIMENVSGQSVEDVIDETQSWLLNAMTNDIFSFEEIRRDYGISSEVLFAYQDEDRSEGIICGYPAKRIETPISQAMARFGLDVWTKNGRIMYKSEWDPAYYSSYTIDGFISMLDHIAGELLIKDKVDEITLVSKEEEEVIRTLHDTDHPVKERPAYRLLQDTAERYPEKTAVIAADRRLTYKELNEEANAAGHALIEAGAVTDTIVAVLADRDSYAYVMRQGVLKSGGAFMPVDPEYPDERIRFILEDSGSKLILTTRGVYSRRRELIEALASDGVKVLLAEDIVGKPENEDAYINPNIAVPPEALAYVIYTSGSTGTPKGVMLTNKNLVNFVDANEKNREILAYTEHGSISLSIAALTFDFSVMEECVPLANGMTVVLATGDEIMNPHKLTELMLETKADVMGGTPGYVLNLLSFKEAQPALKQLKCIDCGAEVFPPALFTGLKEVNPELYIMNGYGPTEATISCTMDVIENEDDISIGIPNANVHVATIDRDGRLQPLGAVGELVIMGDGVGRGYIGRKELNEKSFIRMLGLPSYRSGDLVRILKNGEIEFHGRTDNQVKLRGLRVELGEIESVLNSCPGVITSIVQVIHGETDYLGAWYTADREISADELKERLSERLTSYMVPQAYMQLQEMPLTANGKIDKKALPGISFTEEELTAPENGQQEELLRLAAEVTGNKVIGIDTDLFAAGLSSLGCIRLCALIENSLNASVRISELFENNTVRRLDKLISEKDEEEVYEIRSEYPLSMTQMGIYVESVKHEGTTVYNIPALLELDPGIDTERLKEALIQTVLQHPYLSMTLKTDEKGNVIAVRNQPETADIEVIKALPEREGLVRPFDLASGEQLYRISIYDTPGEKYLFFDFHHIIMDGVSLDIFFKDLSLAYLGEKTERERYSGYEYALDEEKARASGVYERAKEFYDGIFRGAESCTLPVKERLRADESLKADDGLSAEESLKAEEKSGDTLQTDVSGKEPEYSQDKSSKIGEEGRIAGDSRKGSIAADRVRSYCLEHGLSENAFFTTAFGLALKAYTASEEAVFATIYNGRNDPRLTDSIAMFVKTLPVLIRPDVKEDTGSLIKDCQDYLLKAMSNDIFSFAEISEKYGISSEVLFAYQGDDTDGAGADEIGGYSILKTEDLALSETKASLGVDVRLEGDAVMYDYEYDPGLYSSYTIDGFIGMLDHITGEMLEKATVGDITLVSKEEEEAIRTLHDTDHPVKERPAYRLLQDTAEKYPEKTAVIAADRRLTYKELNEEANAAGHALIEAGAVTDTIVAVLADRDSYAYVMRQGVLKSGGAFMPVDPEYPDERIRFILEDSGSKLILTTRGVYSRRRELLETLASDGVKVLLAENIVGKPENEDSYINPNIAVPPEALAYVIYTSGSTGTPKGVMLTNRNLVYYADANPKNHETLAYTEHGSVSLSMAAFTFDVSITEEFIPIAHGLTNVLATREQILDAAAMRELILENGVDCIDGTPSYYLNMLETEAFREAAGQLKMLDAGAEAFPETLYEKLREVNPDLYIVNTYGPTECTVSCTLKEVRSAEDINIGTPLSNVHVATIDRDGRLQPLGAVGELVIMGDGVGRGYIGRKELNEKSFIRMLGLPSYRSGDLVRILKNGEIEFHGRTDNQVKLRGLRVELGEIESVLNSCPGVITSTVQVIHGETDYLGAWYTAEREISADELKERLSERLTSYMVPQAYMQLQEMPLTANGKIDKKALPGLNFTEEELTPPENGQQEELLRLAAEVTGNKVMGIDTDLFAAGLSSLGCIRLCALIENSLNASVRISELFENNTVRKLDTLIAGKEAEEVYEIRSEYPLSMTQMGIYVESVKHEGTTVYNIPALLELDPGIDTERLREALIQTVLQHPYLSMTLKTDEKGNVIAVRNQPETADIEVIKALPEREGLVRSFDLASGEQLYRISIYDTPGKKYLFFDFHHIIMDGVSLDIFLKDLSLAYLGEKTERERYSGYEYALDEEKARASGVYERAKEFYDGIFRGTEPCTLPVKERLKADESLKADDGLSAEESLKAEEKSGDTLQTDVSGKEPEYSQDKSSKTGEDGRIAGDSRKGSIAADRVRSYCLNHGLSENAFFTTAFGLALKAYTASEEAVFATIYNGRNDPRLTDSIAMFVKTLPVLIRPDVKEDTGSLIKDCQDYLLKAMSNDIFSFAEISEKYGISSEVLFAYQGDDTDGVGADEIGGYSILKTEDLALSEAKASLGVDVRLEGDAVMYDYEYDPGLYSSYTIDGFIGMLDHIVGELLIKDKVGDITLVSKEEEEAIRTLHDTDHPVKERPAYRLLQDTAEKYPERTAVIAADRRLTYKELNEEANAAGHALIEAGAVTDTIVAVLADRDSYAYVMRQGVLKSGGAFMPVDPEYPDERIRFILEDSGSKLILTTGNIYSRRGELLEALASDGVKVLLAENIVGKPENEDSYINPNIAVPPEALAYVIYTSGSTGTPKGVMLTNKNLVNFVDANEKNREILGYTEHGSVSLSIAALTFDFSVMEEFVPIANGMTAVLATGDEIMNPHKLTELMLETKADVMSGTPGYVLNLLSFKEAQPALKQLKSIDFGAEAFPPALFTGLKEINPELYIMNGYGPTEATISCTMDVIENEDDISIGIPNANVHVATIDRDGRLQPLGAVGELVIMGDGVGRGYIGRKELNEKSFIRMLGLPSYRSGDLVRILKNGEIEFHGRTDNQVKLRGLRVELGEIESVLNSCPGVITSIVQVIHGETDYLGAWYTADREISADELKERLSERLTSYMVPQAYMQLKEMPLTANGKIDKKALPGLSFTEEELTPPENVQQEELLRLAAEITGNKVIGIDTDLFAAGLSSLGCIRLCALIENSLNASVRISELFENNTVRKLDKLISEKDEEEVYEIRSEYPLSMTQMGIFIESIRYKEEIIYNIPSIFRLDPAVDTEKLRDAAVKTILNHPYLGMTLKQNEDSEVIAVRNQTDVVEVPVISSIPDPEELVKPFDLNAGKPLYRIYIFDTGDEKYLFMDFHHIIMDGVSLDIFLEDLNRAYEGEALVPERFSAYEYALYEQKARGSEAYERAKEFYEGIFKGAEPCTLPVKERLKADEELNAEGRLKADESLNTDERLSAEESLKAEEKPGDNPHTDVSGKDPEYSQDRSSKTGEEGRIAGDSRSGSIAADRVRSFCKEHDLTENVFFTTAFGLALKAYTASEEAVFATIYNGRNDPRLTESIAMFVKTLPVMIRGEAGKNILTLLSECGEYLIGAMSHDIFSFAEINEEFGITSDVLFSYQGDSADNGNLKIGGYPAEEIEDDRAFSQAKASIDMNIFLEGNDIVYDCDYDPGMYSSYTIDGFISMLDHIVGELLIKDKVGDITLVSKEEEEAIRTLHDTDHPVKERPAYRLLQDTAEKYPERTAVIAADRRLTYKELNEEANAAGHALIEAGAVTDTIVAVLADRDSYAYVMRQGVLKSGGAFMPVDPEYPDERIRFILEDSGSKLILTTRGVYSRRRELLEVLASDGVKVLLAEDIVGKPDNEEAYINPNISVPTDALAYVIYTSGSTGTPKGVMLTNKNLVNFVDANEKNREILGYTERGSVSLSIAALTFDFSVMEEFVPIANGMTAVLATGDEIMNPHKLTELMLETKADVMSGTPGYVLNLLSFKEAQPALKQLKSIDFGAEAFPPALFTGLKEINPELYIMNGYGPTEATISCTMDVIENEDDISIGIPNANVHVATIDRDGRLQPLGAVGELVIMGDGVGRGYIGRKELNEKSFIRMLGLPSYRSGDLVRILKSGEIEFHGRTDNQVKLRGLRVELGEIESVLNSCPGVITSIVQVIHGETDYLGAWYTADREIGADELKERLSERLTSYMVPQAYMQLQEMPLTANGKIDKKALPKLNGGESRRSFKQPETELQEKLCELFKKALGLSVIGIDEDFFELGGTSLAAAKVLMGAMAQDIPVEYQDIFDARTVEKLEQRLLGRKSASVEHYSSVIIQEGAKRFDEEDVRGILSHNTTEYVDDIRHGDIGNVLLTGATGFLGIHVLKELMDNSGGNIICLVRGRHGASGNVSAESRLRMMLYYYFNRDYAELFGNRLTVREVDITDRESLAELLNESFDTVINCAASVKHFADYDSLKAVNVDGVQNLIELCLKKKARLIQTSTVSVSGESLDGAVTADSLKEDNLNIGQDTESNAYVHTKYIAEECVLKAVAEKGLDAKIMRLGNLMSRHEDSEFQINFRTSSFMSTLKAYAYLGCCPYSAMDEQTDFSPIDETARGIIALSGTSSDFTVFHVFNSHMVDMGDVFRAMVNCGIHLDMVSDDEFEERIRGELAEGKMSLEIAPLISYRLGDDDLRQDIPCDNRFTVQALYRLGFRWSITDERYLEHTVNMLQTLGFFDVP